MANTNPTLKAAVAQQQSQHILGLDSIRFFAASLTVFCHIEMAKHYQGLPAYVSEHFIYESKVLVSAFFVMSGFLITGILLKEKQKYGSVNLSSFYKRRAIRILPLYYLILLLLFFVLPHFSAFYLPAQSEDLQQHFVLKLFFGLLAMPQMLLVKFQHIPSGVQLWTVGVEIIFYLLWPLVLRKSKNELTLAIGLIAGILTTKWLLYKFSGNAPWPQHPGLIYRTFLVFYYNRLDCLLLGAIAAILVFRKNSEWLKLVTNTRYTMTVIFCLAMLFLYGLKVNSVDYFFYSLAFTWLFSSLALLKEQKPSRLLSIFEWMGRLSYGIYLWHFIMLFIAFYVQRQIFPDTERNSISANAVLYFTTYLLTYTMSILSFYFFESPFLKLKERLSP